jgi:hypothetical protein
MTSHTEQAQWATHLIKIYPSSKQYGGVERFDSWLRKVMEDGSIGIDYRLTAAMNEHKTKDLLLDAMNRNRLDNGDPKLTNGSKWPYYVDMFINKLQIGDKVLLIRGANEVLYVATIDSGCYFTNEIKWKNGGYSPGGFYHRRRLKDIQPLPKNTVIKSPCVTNIKVRPGDGWELGTIKY